MRRWVPRRFRRSVRLEAWLPAATGGRVLAGPFSGLSYVGASRGSAYWPKLLGTYELELASIVERVVAKAPGRVLVAGAAEGYYAIGLAVRLPQAEVIAWEPDAAARGLIQELGGRNGVAERVRIGRLCDAPALAAALEGSRRPFLLVDIDGGEAVLMDPRIVPALCRTDVLVETHDCFVPGVTEELVRRFEATHEVTRVDQRPRFAGQVASLQVPKSWTGALEQLLSERRPEGNSWLWLEARCSK